ncbi:MAG: hypothetical protein IJ054_06505 [Lachnospiraceae bacterium]|nr:hypothetical protein [Lachnospiraceae bacterium]MBQ9232833.1 hypothetical protein [Lachnospiraceae bacterium]
MKKKYISMILCLVLCSSLFGCGKTSDSDNKNTQDTESSKNNDTEVNIALDYSENDIILVRDYNNYAEGFVRYGYFVDGGGNIYNYSFSDGFYGDNSFYSNGSYSMIEELQAIQKYAEPTGSCDTSLVEMLYTEGMQIDPAAKPETGPIFACDAGQSNLYFHNPKTDEFIVICGAGDTELIPTDKHSEIISNLEGKIDVSERSSDPIMLFTPDYYNYANAHCGYMDGLEGDYVLLSQGEVAAFRELTDFDINTLFPNISTDEEDYPYGRYIYFVNIENVPSTGYNIVYDAMLKQGDKYVFIPGKNYKTPEPEETVGEAMDGFINVYAVCFADSSPEYYDFLDWGGEPLKRVEASDIPNNTTSDSDYDDIWEMAAGEYYFASGAGAWSTDLTLYEDGSFDAQYHDSNMGESGDGYDGTTYFGICSGQFTITGKVDDNIYEMSMEITDHSPSDLEYIETYEESDYKNRMVSSDVYGIDGGTTFWLILEGAPTDELPEGFISWMAMSRAWGNDIPDTLPFNGIYNIDGDAGFGQ